MCERWSCFVDLRKLRFGHLHFKSLSHRTDTLSRDLSNPHPMLAEERWILHPPARSCRFGATDWKKVSGLSTFSLGIKSSNRAIKLLPRCPKTAEYWIWILQSWSVCGYWWWHSFYRNWPFEDCTAACGLWSHQSLRLRPHKSLTSSAFHPLKMGYLFGSFGLIEIWRRFAIGTLDIFNSNVGTYTWTYFCPLTLRSYIRRRCKKKEG